MMRLAHYLDNRLIEWTVSGPITVLGVMLFIWPQITKAPAFQLFSWMLPSPFIATSFVMIGLVCIAALLVNGASKAIGPRVRQWCALGRAVLMLQFGLSTLQAGIVQGYPYTVTPFWFSFAMAEVWVAYRAVLDVRPPH